VALLPGKWTFASRNAIRANGKIYVLVEPQPLEYEAFSADAQNLSIFEKNFLRIS
jgi:hypothetical protein